MVEPALTRRDPKAGGDLEAAVVARWVTAEWSPCESAHDRRDDAIVALEDQVVDVGRRYGTQVWQLCRCLLLVEQVERPIADGPACRCG